MIIRLNALLILTVAVLSVGCDGREGEIKEADDFVESPAPYSSTTEHDSSDEQVYLDAINTARSIGRDCGRVTGEYADGTPIKEYDGTDIYLATDPLVWNESLSDAAYEHSQDLANSNTFSHDGSYTGFDLTAITLGLDRGSYFIERIVNNGYTGTVKGENIAAGTYFDTAQEAIDAWLNSPPHCANLMDPNFTDVGMSHAYSSSSTYSHYWTQNFGGQS